MMLTLLLTLEVKCFARWWTSACLRFEQSSGDSMESDSVRRRSTSGTSWHKGSDLNASAEIATSNRTMVQVVVRVRPLSAKESARGEDVVTGVPSRAQLVMHEPRARLDGTPCPVSHVFDFDAVFGPNDGTSKLYKEVCCPSGRDAMSTRWAVHNFCVWADRLWQVVHDPRSP